MIKLLDHVPFMRVLIVLCLFAHLPCASSRAQSNSPNFLFVFVDDQPWNGTSVAMMPGHEFSRTPGFHMPNLERIAAEGMVFSQAYASHPKCECSRAALLMGRSTTSLNAVDKTARNWNATSDQSLANTLKRANSSYRAAHFGKWQWPQTPESMGYDASDGITMNSDGDTDDPLDPKQSFGITRRAQIYMDRQVAQGHPFYLQLSYYAPHSKPQALSATLEKYKSASTNSNSKGKSSISPLMAAMTEDLDTCIGMLLTHVDQLGIANNTYVIYMSDNGGNTGILKGTKGLVDEGGLRVPLIVKGPGVQAGSYCHTPVVGYDILATVLDFASPGYELPAGVEGGSWKSVLQHAGVGSVDRPIPRLIFHHDVEVPHPQTAMRKGDLKLVYHWDIQQSFLYDLSTDLGESHNLAEQQPAVVIEMLKELKAHVRNGLGERKFVALDGGQIQRSEPERPKGSGKDKKEQKKLKANPNT